MYNRLYQHLQNNKLLYNKQFGFQKANSTDHAIIQLADQLYDSFNDNKFTVGIFIDLSKAFDTVDHEILLEKLHHYGIQGNNLKWFRSYLTNRKQFLIFNKKQKSKTLNISCGVPQGSILGPLLFQLYVNDLAQASNIIRSIMFADDTNLFYSHKDINLLFRIINEELQSNSKYIGTTLNISKKNQHHKRIKSTAYDLSSRSKSFGLVFRTWLRLKT